MRRSPHDDASVARGPRTSHRSCHGEQDAVVRHQFGKAAAETLRSGGVRGVAFNSYPGLAHSASEEEVGHVRDFLSRVVPPR